MVDTREPSPRSSQVYRGGQPEEDKDDKTKTPGEVLAESGEYLKDPETEVDTSQPLKSKSFEIDPNKNTPTEREKQREDRLRQRAGSGQQGANIAKKKLPKSKQTDLPQFLQSTEMEQNYKREQIGDEADVELQTISDEAGGLQNLDERTRIEVLTRVGRKMLNRGSAQQQLEYVETVLKYGTAAAMIIFSALTAPLQMRY